MELLERASHLAVLDTVLIEAVSGNGRVALISGEAGIGKTVLVEQFTTQSRRKARVLWGVCDALFTPRPLGPVHDIATQTRSPLQQLLTLDAKRAEIFEGCLNELQHQPTIMVFEDVHWADEATLDLLKFLGRRIQHTPSLLILIYRDEEVGPQHVLRTLLGDLATSAAVRRIHLTPLSEQAVRALIGQRTFDPIRLCRQTGGNPFFITEVLSSTTNHIPATVRDAILARVARLSPSGYAVLQAAAVIGVHCEMWLLADVTGAEVKAVDESIAIGMLLAHGETLAFRHELARQTILDAISPHRRMVLHRLVYAALKASPLTRHDLARLAHHAAATNDREAVLECVPAAARQSSAASAHRAAATLYELALRYGIDGPPDERAAVFDEYSIECDALDRRAEAIEARRQAAELWRAAGDQLKQGRSLGFLALLLDLTGNKAEALEVNQTAIQILEALPPNQELVLVYNTQAILHLSNLENQQGIAVAEKAIALAEQLEDTPRLPRLYETLGLCWLHIDQTRGCDYLERSLATARKLGQIIRTANTMANLASVYVEFYDFHRAEPLLNDGLIHTTLHELDSVKVYIQGWQAIMFVHLGRWHEAADLASEILRRPDISPGRGPALIALGRLRARQGDPGADTALDEALDLLIKMGYRQREGMIRAARAEAAWMSGDQKRTLVEARAVYDFAGDIKHPWVGGELAFWRWRAGDEISAATWMAQPFAYHMAGDWRAAAYAWQQLGCPYEQARALADGDQEAQIAALAIFERLGAQPAAAEVRGRLRATGLYHLPRAATRGNPNALTQRQLDILALLVDGLTNPEIAARLQLSPKTVDHHVSAVLAKLDVHSREAAADLARQPSFFKLEK